MKHVIGLMLIALSLAGVSQDTAMVFQSSSVAVNLRGEKIVKSLDEPLVIRVDLQANTITIETTMPEVKELFRNKMTQPINATMGELGDEFSLTVDQFTFAHFYLDDRKMILFTRNDIHPLKWGMMLKEVTRVE